MALGDRTKASLLWGATGALGFLVLSQAYVLLTPAHVSLLSLLGVAAAVFIIAAAVSYTVEPRFS